MNAVQPDRLENREHQWCTQCETLEQAIARTTARGDVVFADRLKRALDDLEDERCDSCGKFEDDLSDAHADDCRFSRMPRPSIDWDGNVPVLEQLRQVLLVNRMSWSEGDSAGAFRHGRRRIVAPK